MELQEVLEGRYSCRKFTPELPSKELIEAVLEAGALAPTACNYQPQKLYVVTDEGDLAKIDEATRCRYGAPCVIIVGYDEDVASHHGKLAPGSAIDDWSFGDLDATSVLMQMLLKAHELGMATCWLGAFAETPLREAFNLPENYRVRALIDLGFADPEKGGPAKMHTDRKPLSETVTWL